MRVKVKGLPPNTDFDFFVIQVPNAPFGLSWYQGDVETNAGGRGTGTFVGRFTMANTTRVVRRLAPVTSPTTTDRCGSCTRATRRVGGPWRPSRDSR
jgi:hypothetical protein